ncbi:MAG: histidine kinase [Owenweeksia sp.]|nr:histidine kinase [Owenweeksia sp.]
MLQGDSFQFFTTADGLASNWVKSIVEDTSGTIWAASAGGGITKINTDSTGVFVLGKFTTRDGLQSNRVIDLHIDQYNRLWYASQDAGIGFIQSDSIFRSFTTAKGLNSNHIRSLAEDDFGNLWIASIGGLNALPLYSDSLSIVSIPDQEISSNNIYLLQTDHENNLWVGTEKGLDRLKLDSSLNVLESTYFGPDEGFTGVETNLNASCLDRENRLWFGTVNGLQRYLSQSDVKNEIPPILNFTEVSLDYVPLEETEYYPAWKKGKSPEFRHDENHLSFDFLGITQTLPKKVQYKWRLMGLEEAWSPASGRNSVTYSNLSPGSYRFQVLSANEDGVWNSEPLEMEFRILAPFWKKTWFIISTILLGILIIALIITARIRILKRKARENQERLSMERDLISLEQKALRLQMNPHFIFHTLNSIQALIATKDEDTARTYLSKFSKLMRQILENSRSEKISLEAEIETLENYLGIERFCNEEKFDFKIEVEDDLETEFIMIPPMILQPFVENAIIHGIRPLKSQGEIELSFGRKTTTSSAALAIMAWAVKKPPKINPVTKAPPSR